MSKSQQTGVFILGVLVLLGFWMARSTTPKLPPAPIAQSPSSTPAPLSPKDAKLVAEYRKQQSVDQLMRTMTAVTLERSLLRVGLDVQVASAPDAPTKLMVVGQVSRPLAFNLMTHKFAQTLSNAGFTEVNFWNRQSDYMETYSLPPRNNLKTNHKNP